MQNPRSSSPAALLPGTRLGRYEITGFVAAGGMGDVYRAKDPSLGREVAIKLLPADVAADSERRARFEREARIAAALNHSNIVTIHSVEQDGDRLFITMELVKGSSLADLIPRSGLPIEKLLTIAVPLTNAVSAAHDNGITHRDLKPANVVVSDDGVVKVLDFGIAKRHDIDASTDLAETASLATAEGSLLGTIDYMSPEQAEGKPADRRSDVFSLGTMLYEMATGRRPFSAGTNVATLAAIVRDTPAPLTAVNPRIPKELARIIRRAMMKDPDRRQQSAKDLRNELEDLRRQLESGELASTDVSPPRRGAMVWILVAAGIIAAIGATVLWPRGEASGDLATGAAALTGLTVTSVTTEDGLESFPSLSPDGKWVVYAADERGTGQTDILLRSVGGLTAINLTRDSPADDLQPVFSPDGERIAFRSERDGGGLFVMERTGESVRLITNQGFNPSWSPDGRELAFGEESVSANPRARAAQGSDIWVVSILSGDRRRLTRSDGVQPSWSPHGQQIAFWSVQGDNNQRDIWTVSPRGGEPTRVTADAAVDWNPTWSPDGRHLYFSSDRAGGFGVWRLNVDETTGQAIGSPEAVSIPAVGLAHFSFSADGQSVAMSSLSTVSNIEVLTVDLTRAALVSRRPLTRRSATSGDTGEFAGGPEVSPDGLRLAFSYERDLWVQNTDGTGLRQLTRDAFRDMRPAWSTDGTRLLFDSDRAGRFQIWSINADGSGLRQVTDDPGFVANGVFSPDGARAMAFRLFTSESFMLDPRADVNRQNIERLPDHPGGFQPWSWSADGQRVAGQVPRQQGSIVIYSVPERRFRILTETGRMPKWLPDGRRLLYTTGSQLRLLDTSTRAASTVLGVVGEVIGGFGISPGAREIFATVSKPQGDIVIAKLAGGTF